MPPFPKGVELPKYDKYLGTSDPQDHLWEFGALSMEFIHDQTYLMRLFPRSLGGPAMEWFSRLPSGIKSFDEIATLFLQHYSHNIQHLVTIRDLCNLKQRHGEPFLTFLQRWRQLYTKYSRKIPENEKLDIFLDNLVPEFGYLVQLQGPLTFDDMIKQAVRIETFMVKKGDLTVNKDNKQGSSSNKDKPKATNKNHDVVNDGIVDNLTTKPPRAIFNLTTSLQAAKAIE